MNMNQTEERNLSFRDAATFLISQHEVNNAQVVDINPILTNRLVSHRCLVYLPHMTGLLA